MDPGDLLCPGFGDVDEAVGGHGEVVRLHVGGDFFDCTGGWIDGDDAVFCALAGVQQSVWSELESADGFLDDFCAFSVGGANFVHGGGLHIGEVEVPVAVGAGSVSEAEFICDDLPTFAGDELAEDGHVAFEIAFGVEGDGLVLIFAPEPFDGIGEECATVVTVVSEAFCPVEADVIAHVLESGGHEFVREGPASELVVDVAAGVGEVDPEGFLFGFADDGRVDISAADVGETADGGEHFPESVGPFPSDGEGADAAGACAADGVEVGVLGEGVGLLDFGDDLFEEEAGVFVAEAVVFYASVRAAFWVGGGLTGFGFKSAGVDEYRDGHGHIAACDEVVEDDWHAPAAFGVFVPFAVLEDHESGGFPLFVLGWDVDGPVAGGICEDVGLPSGHIGHGAMGDVGAFDGIWVGLPGGRGGWLLGAERQGCSGAGDGEEEGGGRFHGKQRGLEVWDHFTWSDQSQRRAVWRRSPPQFPEWPPSVISN